MPGSLRNSLPAAVIATIFPVTPAIPAAYALSIRRVKNVENSLSFFISTRFMPLAAIVLPLFFGRWYLLDAKSRYQGPIRTLEEDVVTRD